MYEHLRWSIFNGIAHYGDDGTGHCRIAHPAICPAVEHDDDLTAFQGLRLRYAVQTKAWIDKGEFVPAQREREVTETEVSEQFIRIESPVRHIIDYPPARFLAPTAIDKVQCIVRATTTNQRCNNTVFDPERPEGHWEQVDIPMPSGRAGAATLWAGQKMWVYSLTALYTDAWRRWRYQRCTAHESTTAPDATMDEWLRFETLRHSEFIVYDRPEDLYKRKIESGASLFRPSPGRYKCANCTNRSYEPQSKDWLCWQCAPVAARRERVHAKWRSDPPPPVF
ncbi:hypothetical protein J7E93_07575 [Streptomyces sp. ISL-36]|nr:hypothetical protein [Streptomyces sp. ISL-36]